MPDNEYHLKELAKQFDIDEVRRVLEAEEEQEFMNEVMRRIEWNARAALFKARPMPEVERVDFEE